MPDAGRVIAGSAKGVRLRAPGPGTRPLADRVKQTLFAILEPELAGARVLDLFAGSGAGGIEALSRGAAAAVFVERDQGAAAVIDANLRATGLAGPAAAIVRWDVVRWLAEPNVDAAFDLVLVDPPYADTGTLARVLEILGRGLGPHVHVHRLANEERGRPGIESGMRHQPNLRPDEGRHVHHVADRGDRIGRRLLQRLDDALRY